MNKKPTYNQKQKTLAIIQGIQQAVQTYDQNLVGKTFLYVYENRCIEVIYRSKDFLHMTGVDTKLSATDFYKNAKNGKLSIGQIFFSTRHPFNLCKLKVSQLSNFISVINSPLLILEDLQTQTLTYKFGLTELNFTVCLDHDSGSTGIPVSNYYVVRSLRVEDSFSRGQDAYEVNFIFCKNNTSEKYSTVTYKDAGKSINSLPQNILEKLDETLYK